MTLMAVKFKNWIIPKTGRLDPYVLSAKSSLFSPFRMNGAVAGYGTGKKPLSEKIHTCNFVLRKGCEADLQEAKDYMMSNLLDGQGRLWFDTPTSRGPRTFCLADFDNMSWETNPANWGMANVQVEFQVYNPILYRPLSAGYMTTNGYTPVTIGDPEFGEPGEEHVFASFPVNASPTTFSIINEGQMRTDSIIIRVESLAVNGYTNPRIDNLTTEQWIKFLKTGSTTSHIIQANCAIGPHRVRESTDGGLSFVNDPTSGNIWADTQIADTQVPLMEMVPGENEFSVTSDGSPNFRVLILWRPAYGMV